MKWLVHGYRTQVVAVEVEADGFQEAMDLVAEGEFNEREVDVFDSNYEWHIAYVQD